MVELSSKAKEAEVKVELPEDEVTLEVLLNTRDYVVLKESMSLTTVTWHQWIK